MKNIRMLQVKRILLLVMVLLMAVVLLGAAKGKPKPKRKSKTEILWTGFWDTGLWRGIGPYEYYCVVTEKDFLRTLTVYKPTAKGMKKIFSFSDYDSFLWANTNHFYSTVLNTYWSGGAYERLRIFECDPETDKIKLTYENGYKEPPQEIDTDNGESYLMEKDKQSFYWDVNIPLSCRTAHFYKKVPQQGYSYFTSCRWDDRFLMLDALSKLSTDNEQEIVRNDKK